MVATRETSELWSTRLAVCALVCGLGAGCSSDDTANIGDGELSVDKSELASYAADWDGYVEAYTFPSGSDRVHVSLDEQGNGWLRVGDAGEPAPPTNPDVGWPERAADDPEWFKPAAQDQGVMEGFRYPITGAVVEQERIRLSVDTYDAFNAWCEMQTPVRQADETVPAYGCSPNAGGYNGGEDGCTVETAESELIPIDCGKAWLCSIGGVCACDVTACTADDGPSVPLDAALSDDGQNLVGSMVYSSLERVVVRLERQ